MTLTASNTSLVLVLLDANLRALGFVVHNLSLDGHLGQIGGGKGDLVTIDNEGDREFHGIALLSVEKVHEDDLANLAHFLMATDLHNRVHYRSFYVLESYLA